MYIDKSQQLLTYVRLGITHTHQVGGTRLLEGARDNDHGIARRTRALFLEHVHHFVNLGFHVGHAVNQDGIGATQNTTALTGHTLGGGQDENGAVGTEFGHLGSGGPRLGADNEGLGLDVNGGLDGGGGNRLGGGEGSVTGEGGVTHGLVQHVGVLGTLGFAASVGHDGNGRGGVFTVGSFSTQPVMRNEPLGQSLEARTPRKTPMII